MFAVALTGREGLGHDRARSLVRGKLDIDGTCVRYLAGYLNPAVDGIRCEDLCRVSAQQMLGLLSEGLFWDSDRPIEQVLQETVAKTLVTTLSYLDGEQMLDVIDLVLSLSHGPGIVVGATNQLAAYLRQNGSLEPVVGTALSCPGSVEGSRRAGHLVRADVDPGDLMLAVAPAQPDLLLSPQHGELRRTLCSLDSSRQVIQLLSKRLAESSDSGALAIVGFARSDATRARSGGKGVVDEQTQQSAGPVGEGRSPVAQVGPELREGLRAIEQKLADIQSAIEELPATMPQDDRPWERLLQHLNEREQNDVDKNVVQPMLQRLMLTYDRLMRADGDPGNGVLEALHADILEILNTYGVEPFRSPGGRFDGKLQRCVDHEMTSSPSGDGMICDRLRWGFRRGEEILRHEEVLVWRHEEPNSQNEEE